MARKQKQKQKQTQKQSVVVNIHEKKAKKRRPRKKKAEASTEPIPPPQILGLPKVPPIVVQFTEPPQPPPQPQLQAQAPAQQPPPPPPRQPAILAEQREPPRLARERQPNILEGREPSLLSIPSFPSSRESSVSGISALSLLSPSGAARPSSDILRPTAPIAFEELVAEGPRTPSQRAEEERQQELIFEEPVGGGATTPAKEIKLRTPSGYPDRRVLIRRINDATTRYTPAELAVMRTDQIRKIYDNIQALRKEKEKESES